MATAAEQQSRDNGDRDEGEPAREHNATKAASPLASQAGLWCRTRYSPLTQASVAWGNNSPVA